MKQMQIRVFTAFSGYDSQCLALDRLSRDYPNFSYELVGWSEIDKYAISAHNALYPEAAHLNFGDISKIDWGGQIPDFDLFTYSFPCQDISSAGHQRGFAEGSGSRSSLLWECRRAIEAKHPRFLLMENVKALIQKKHLPDFHKWISWLEEQGYKNFWQVLNAKDYGVPQNRERVFMVSILDPKARFEFPKPFPLERRLKDVLEPSVDESFYLKPHQVEQIIVHCERKQAEGCGFKTNFIDPQDVMGGVKSAVASKPKKALASTTPTSRSKQSVKMLRYPHGYYQGGMMQTDEAPTLTTSHYEANNFIIEDTDNE